MGIFDSIIEALKQGNVSGNPDVVAPPEGEQQKPSEAQTQEAGKQKPNFEEALAKLNEMPQSDVSLSDYARDYTSEPSAQIASWGQQAYDDFTKAISAESPQQITSQSQQQQQEPAQAFGSATAPTGEGVQRSNDQEQAAPAAGQQQEPAESGQKDLPANNLEQSEEKPQYAALPQTEEADPLLTAPNYFVEGNPFEAALYFATKPFAGQANAYEGVEGSMDSEGGVYAPGEDVPTPTQAGSPKSDAEVKAEADTATQDLRQRFSMGRGGNIESALYTYLVDNYEPRFSEIVGSNAIADVWDLYSATCRNMAADGQYVIVPSTDDFFTFLGTDNDAEALQFVTFCNDAWGMYSSLCDENGQIDERLFTEWLYKCRSEYDTSKIFNADTEDPFKYADLFALDYDMSKSISDTLARNSPQGATIYSPEMILALGAFKRFQEQQKNYGDKFNLDDVQRSYQQMADAGIAPDVLVGDYSPSSDGGEYTANNMLPQQFWDAAWTPAYEKALEAGASEEDARAAGDAAGANWLVENLQPLLTSTNAVPDSSGNVKDSQASPLGLYAGLNYLGGRAGYKYGQR